VGWLHLSDEIRAWLWAFLFTQAVEVPIWAWALRRRRRAAPDRAPWPVWLCLAAGFGASAITHPFVWFAFPRYGSRSYLVMVIEAESFAVGVEALYTGALGLEDALAWSVVANASSLGLGLASRAFFGWP
jgi:hypothetical protein